MQQVIALVDNDLNITTLLNDLLSDEGYRTFTVTESTHAHATISREMPDLVILDLWLEHKGTGWTIYDALRADEATAHIPILICSADVAAVRARAAALDACGDGALEKPFNIIELLTLIDRLLVNAAHARTFSTRLQPI